MDSVVWSVTKDLVVWGFLQTVRFETSQWNGWFGTIQFTWWFEVFERIRGIGVFQWTRWFVLVSHSVLSVPCSLVVTAGKRHASRLPCM